MANDFVPIGKIGKPFGVKGWVKVYSYTDPPDKILSYLPWVLKEKNGWQEIELESSRWHDEQLVAKLVGFDTPETVKKLTNLLLGTTSNSLPKGSKKTGYYWHELEGLKVITVGGVVLGTVQYLMETGANDVFVVQGERERVLPYLPGQVVMNVDLLKGEIIVNWDPEF